MACSTTHNTNILKNIINQGAGRKQEGELLGNQNRFFSSLHHQQPSENKQILIVYRYSISWGSLNVMMSAQCSMYFENPWKHPCWLSSIWSHLWDSALTDQQGSDIPRINGSSKWREERCFIHSVSSSKIDLQIPLQHWFSPSLLMSWAPMMIHQLLPANWTGLFNWEDCHHPLATKCPQIIC